jgi:Ankyrin repeats (3 copies)/Ankyrin repeats (many copies)
MNMDEKFIQAVLDGDNVRVKRLLQQSPGIAQARIKQDRLIEAIPHWLYVGDTALHLAAAALKARTVEYLLDTGADPSAENRRGATPLHYACDARPALGTWDPSSQAETIDLLIRYQADLQHADRGGVSALHRAVRARSPVAVRHLLKAGARVDGKISKRGSTPLHLAVRSTGAGGTAGAVAEQVEIIRLLLEHGADPTLPDATGKSAYDSARNASVREILLVRQTPKKTVPTGQPESRRSARHRRPRS